MSMQLVTEKNLFDKGQYVDLSDKIAKAAASGDADAQVDVNDLKKIMDSFFNYVASVDSSEVRIALAYATMDGQELRDYVTMWDATRRNNHEAAIVNVRALNRYARFYGCGKIFLGDDQNRDEVADFCLQVTVEIFRDGRSRK